jgi:integrase
MPRYTNPEFTRFNTEGTMNFKRYQDFKDDHNKIIQDRDKQLHTIIYFTGARPAEILEIKRGDISLDGSKIIFKVQTFKLGKIGDTPKRKVRFIKWANFKQYQELKELWSSIQSLPNEFYIFGWLKMYHNPRDYIIHHIGLPAYFYRHNILSLLSMAGGREDQLFDMKGGGSIESYKHISKNRMDERARLLSKAIK